MKRRALLATTMWLKLAQPIWPAHSSRWILPAHSGLITALHVSFMSFGTFLGQHLAQKFSHASGEITKGGFGNAHPI